MPTMGDLSEAEVRTATRVTVSVPSGLPPEPAIPGEPCLRLAQELGVLDRPLGTVRRVAAKERIAATFGVGPPGFEPGTNRL